MSDLGNVNNVNNVNPNPAPTPNPTPNPAPAPNQGGNNFAGLLGGGKGKWILIAVVAILVIWGISSYNGLVTAEETVEKSWSDVEAQYQRRANLIPNLVNVVKGYAKHEQETFEAVTNARASVGKITVDAQNMTDEQLAQFQKAQEQMSGALSKLLAVSESYPELKANENFRDLQAQLEGTENRITKAVTDFNESAQEYNIHVRKFPTSIFAGIFGFKTKPRFKAKEGAEDAPTVQF